MIRIRLERFFELPIIPAPKRNSKPHCEMRTNPFLPRAFWAPGPGCEALHEAQTGDTAVLARGKLTRISTHAR
jgi:hypothetical protein